MKANKNMVSVSHSDLAAVIAYLEHDERRDYLATGPEDRRDHIYPHVFRLAHAAGIGLEVPQ
jgi:hypothetical protein